ncbi:MAG TPA: alpha/beta hydrolase [Acidimicrobiales bacterium]|nr:alpha/beta hydrolase [Acidimicrobiales bacterium]
MSLDLERRFAIDDIDLAWDRWGPEEGTPLVLCHGYTGSSMDFGLQIPHLAAARGVMALDHRGHGLSTNTNDEADYDFDRLAVDLAAWLAAVAGGPVDLLGHSMGGRVVLQVALDHPELVRSLVLMDTSAAQFSSDAATVEVMEGFLTAFDPTRGLPSLVYEGVGPEQDLIESVVDAKFLAGRAERSAMMDPWAFRALGRQLIAPDLVSLVPRLGELAMPVTVVAGSLDHPLVELAPEMAGAIPDAELVVIEGAYHSPQLTHPDEWRAALVAHLARAAAHPA